MALMENEPIGQYAIIATAITSVVGAIAAFGFNVTEAQGDAIATAVVSVIAAGTFIWGLARRKTTPYVDPDAYAPKHEKVKPVLVPEPDL